MKHKLQTIIDVFIKSIIPPELQIDVPLEIAERICEKACGPTQHYGPYIFREAQVCLNQIFVEG